MNCDDYWSGFLAGAFAWMLFSAVINVAWLWFFWGRSTGKDAA